MSKKKLKLMDQFIKHFFISAALVFISGYSYSQFTLGAELRPRAEYRHGYKTLAAKDQEPAAFIDQRSRLNFKYETPKFRLFVQIQDVRTWGSTSQLEYNTASTTLHQAWGEISIGERWALRAGRQEWVYDASRMLGNVAWAQQARSHDGVLLKFNGKDDLSLHLGGAFNQDGPGSVGTVYTTPNSYKSLVFLWANKKFSDQFSASLLFLNNGAQPFTTDSAGTIDHVDRYSQTIGTHLEFKKKKLSITGWFYYQMGEDAILEQVDLQASNASLEAAYKLSKKFTVALGAEFFSGQDQTDTTAAYSETQRAFIPLYGTNHKFNGYMDYFYVGNYSRNAGLLDPYFKLIYRKEMTTIGATVHFFQSTADVLDKSVTNEITSMSSGLGTEIDLYFGTKLSKDVILNIGYSQLFATETMQAIKGGDHNATQNWAYVMLIFKPTMLKVEEKPKEE